VMTGKVDADLKDENGRRPLSWAAGSGHEAVVKLLRPFSHHNALHPPPPTTSLRRLPYTSINYQLELSFTLKSTLSNKYLRNNTILASR
jgi:ankyrin repeat protein